MMTFFLTLIISYLVTSLFGFVVHWSLHQRWMGKINASHMAHHQKQYPPGNLSSKTYRSSGKDDSFKFFAVAAVPLILAPFILFAFGLISWQLVLTVLIVEALMGFGHNYFHDAFHIENHWLTCVLVVRDIFRVWTRLHYLHHINMKKNYGIFCFHWDKIFRTFRKQ